jgi:hypothetical protein
MSSTDALLCRTSVVTEPAPGRRFSRWAVGGALIIVLAGLIAGYITLLRAQAAGTFHDDGIYLVTAKALAEGRGYRIISIPTEPPQTKYPILLPWVLSLVWRIYPSFPANLVWLRFVPLIATLTWLCLSWLLLRRVGASKSETAVITLLTAASPWTAFLSTTPMAETLFAAFLAGGLLMITRLHHGDGTRADAFLAGALVGAAVLTRMAGVAPALAGVLTFVPRRRWATAFQYSAGAALVTLPWFWWVMRQEAAATPVETYYSAANYASWNIVASYAWSEKLVVLGMNAIQGGLALPSVWGFQTSSAMLVLPVAATVLVLMSRGLWRARAEPCAMLVAAYCTIHAMWVWPPLRFVVPVVPLLLWFLFVGMGRSRRLGCVAALALFTIGSFQLWRVAVQVREKDIVSPVSNAANWNETTRALEFVSRETPSDATLIGNLDPMYYLFTGRKGVRAYTVDPYLLFYNRSHSPDNPLGTVDGLRNRLLVTKADYVIITPQSPSEEVRHLRQLVNELAEACRGSLSLVAGSVDSGYAIYKADRRFLTRPAGCARDIRG